MPAMNPSRYDQTTIALHWFTALSVVVLWLIGQTADWLPRGAANQFVWSIHVALGLALALVLVGRIFWRAFAGMRLPAPGTPTLQILTKAVHYSLWVLLVVVAALGVVDAFVSRIQSLSSREPASAWRPKSQKVPHRVARARG
ncbi:MAG TPA: cytochrome b/b6 domain-containing protein [Roseiarcus sp.]|nr:cytochrome b/b6 domain-containing protein [Roseiarcus sp.]